MRLSVLVLLAAAPAALAQTPLLFGMPNQIDAGGPTFTASLAGRNFVNGATAYWGATPLPTTFVSSERVDVTIAGSLIALAGTFNVTVKNPSGAVSEPEKIYVQPVILTVGPTVPRLSQSARITATGRGFTPSCTIYILDAGLPRGLITTFVSSTALTATFPADLASVSAQLRVMIMDRSDAFSRAVLLVVGTPPILDSISPSETVIDGATFTLTLTGSAFLPGAVAQWGGNRLPTTFVSSTQLRATVDAALQRRAVATPGQGVSVMVLNPDGGYSTGQPFFFRDSTPTISRVDPPFAYAGAPALTLTVTGTNFYSGSQLQFQNDKLPTQFLSSSQLSAVVPPSLLARSMQANVTVVNGSNTLDAGISSRPFGFPIQPPVLESVSPVSVKAGAGSFTLTANGLGFFSGHAIQWNGSPVATRFLSPTQLTAAIDSGRVAAAGTARVTVVSAGGSASNALEFSIDALPPTISSLSPVSIAAGSPSFTLTVRGANFVRGAVVQWNGSALPTTLVTAAELTAIVASDLVGRPLAVAVSVVTPAGVSNPLPLTVTAALPAVDSGGVWNAFSGEPSIAPGSLVTIFGENLAATPVAADEYPLPRTLGEASVTINGKAAPLLYAGPTQINIQAPFDLTPGAGVLVIQVRGIRSADIPVTVAEIAPGTLRMLSSSHALGVNYPAGALNSAATPARPGEYVIVYLTGQGRVDPAIEAGDAVPVSPVFVPVAPVRARLGGVPAEVAFAGLAPGYAGLLQVNLKIPEIGPGEQILEISIGGVPSNTTVLSVASAGSAGQ